jgi:hypothetical protein
MMVSLIIMVKGKLSLCFDREPRHEGVLGVCRYSSTHSLTSALDGGEWSALRPGRFTPRDDDDDDDDDDDNNQYILTIHLYTSSAKHRLKLPKMLHVTPNIFHDKFRFNNIKEWMAYGHRSPSCILLPKRRLVILRTRRRRRRRRRFRKIQTKCS